MSFPPNSYCSNQRFAHSIFTVQGRSLKLPIALSYDSSGARETESETLGLDTINDALPYLELRHIFVHSDGKPSTEFTAKYPFFDIDHNGRVVLDINLVREAFVKVKTLLSSFDLAIITKGFVPHDEIVS